MYRNTYAEINLKNIEYNVKTLIKYLNNYKYYFGVVKADCYGHNDIKTINAIINGGVNYLCVATLDEALYIREYVKNIPILCLGIIDIKYLAICVENNITITINSLNYLNKVINEMVSNLKVHVKINTGMNRLGVKSSDELNVIHKIISDSNLILEGIYTHIHSPLNKNLTKKQISVFEKITSNIDIKEIPIIHITASDASIESNKLPYVNGCRLGIGMYGLMESKKINLLSTFTLYSEIIQINDIINECVGYNAKYKARGKEKIAVVSIGYADGIIRKNTGRYVYINEKKYKIVGNICMDMLFVRVDETVKVGDKVVIIKDIKHIRDIAKHLDTIPYEIICSIGKRVPRIYVNN